MEPDFLGNARSAQRHRSAPLQLGIGVLLSLAGLLEVVLAPHDWASWAMLAAGVALAVSAVVLLRRPDR
jgi:hypothetical protein